MKDVYTTVIITHTVIYISVMFTAAILYRINKINPDLLLQVSRLNYFMFILNAVVYIMVKFLDL